MLGNRNLLARGILFHFWPLTSPALPCLAAIWVPLEAGMEVAKVLFNPCHLRLTFFITGVICLAIDEHRSTAVPLPFPSGALHFNLLRGGLRLRKEAISSLSNPLFER